MSLSHLNQLLLRFSSGIGSGNGCHIRSRKFTRDNSEGASMMKFESEHNSLQIAQIFDQADKLNHFRQRFSFPQTDQGKDCLYFAGHSLGLMPKQTREFINSELMDWENYGVEGHFEGAYPWLPYHEFVTKSLAKLVGAKESEVVAMNGLTTNLHLMLVSFYRPTKEKFKILIFIL